MKSFRLLPLILFALLAPTRADVTLVQKLEGTSHLNEMTIKVKGDKARFDVTPQVSMIIDSKSGEMINLLRDQKKFIRFSTEQIKMLGEMAGKLAGNKGDEKPKLTPTGKKQTINGYEAEEYTFQSPLWKGSYWLSNSVPHAAEILKQLQAVKPEAWSSALKGLPNYQDFPGLPVKSETSIGKEHITTTLAAVKEDTLSEDEFVIPKGFEEIKAPGIFRGKRPKAPNKPGEAGQQ